MPEFIQLAAVAALIDWWAVLTDRTRIEEVAKPLVPVALIAWVVTAPDPTRLAGGRLANVLDLPPADPTPWIVAALLLGLIGDVLLLPRLNQFIGGLAAFLVGHIAYLPPLLARRDARALLPVILMVLGVAVAIVGRRVIAGAHRHDGLRLAIPVAVYIAVVATIAVVAVATLQPLVAIGGVLFAASDATIGWTRFVRRDTTPRSRTFIHVTYHLAQAGLASMAFGPVL